MGERTARHSFKLTAQATANHCHGRVVSVLEGGYNLTGLASAVTAHVGAVIG